jgi:hydrogenase maturation protease
MSDSLVSTVRVLCLGNDLLADDAVGGVIARRAPHYLGDHVDVVYAANTGFGLIDHLLNVERLIVVDSVLTGKCDPGTVMVITEEDAAAVHGDSPHYIGLFEALALARELQLPTPREVTIVAVEVADCVTVGGPMSSAVQAAVPVALDIVKRRIGQA